MGNSTPIPMENFNIDLRGFDVESGDLGSGMMTGVKMVIEGGRVKKVCRKCAKVEERCDNCGTSIKSPSIHTVVGRSSGDTFRDGEQDMSEGVIYKDVAVERVVEFLTRK